MRAPRGLIGAGLVLEATLALTLASGCGGSKDERQVPKGFIDIYSLEDVAHFAVAAFERPPSDPLASSPSPRCLRSTSGACALAICGSPPAPADDGGLKAGAGTVRLTIDGIDHQLTTDEQRVYGTSGAGPLWTSGGEPVTVSATGDEVPAFSISAPAPGYIDVAAPSFPETNDVTVATTTDLAFAWTGGNRTSQVHVMLHDGNSIAQIDCKFPVDAGKGIVPAVLLEQLSKGPGGSVLVLVESVVDQTVDDWQISMHAWTFGSAPNGFPSGSTDVDFE